MRLNSRNDWSRTGARAQQQLREASHGHLPGFRQAAPMALDLLNLVQGFGGHVALSAVETDYDWNVLDDEQRRHSSVAACPIADLGSTLTTEITRHG
jgi:hypothetical protein